MADVFVSYSQSNRDRVAEIGAGLEQSGHRTWWDRKLLSGDDYGTRIEREIEAASCVLVAWSATARQSLWVRAEANEALDAGKLVQINLDGSKLPLPFTMLHFLDFSRWTGERRGTPWSDLVNRVGRRIAGETADSDPEPLTPGKAESTGPALQGLGWIALLGWTSTAVAALTAFAVILAATGRMEAGLFGGIVLIAMTMAAVLLALTAFTLLRIARASRR